MVLVLLPFLVSISWRVLFIQRELLGGTHPQLSEGVSQTLENWRLFLLGERKQPGTEHHMFVIAGVPERLSGQWHEKTLHYLLRGIDAGTGGDSKTLFVYTKALRTLVFSPVVPRVAKGWVNTKVHSGVGRIDSPQKVEMPGFADFLNSRVTEGHAEPLSDKQARNIHDAIVRQPERSLASESYKVHRASKLLTRKKD